MGRPQAASKLRSPNESHGNLREGKKQAETNPCRHCSERFRTRSKLFFTLTGLRTFRMPRRCSSSRFSSPLTALSTTSLKFSTSTMRLNTMIRAWTRPKSCPPESPRHHQRAEGVSEKPNRRKRSHFRRNVGYVERGGKKKPCLLDTPLRLFFARCRPSGDRLRDWLAGKKASRRVVTYTGAAVCWLAAGRRLNVLRQTQTGILASPATAGPPLRPVGLVQVGVQAICTPHRSQHDFFGEEPPHSQPGVRYRSAPRLRPRL